MSNPWSDDSYFDEPEDVETDEIKTDCNDYCGSCEICTCNRVF